MFAASIIVPVCRCAWRHIRTCRSHWSDESFAVVNIASEGCAIIITAPFSANVINFIVDYALGFDANSAALVGNWFKFVTLERNSEGSVPINLEIQYKLTAWQTAVQVSRCVFTMGFPFVSNAQTAFTQTSSVSHDSSFFFKTFLPAIVAMQLSDGGPVKATSLEINSKS